ncbi:MAG: hypothetical protein M3Q07_21925 [Pseudobdellovibrionaceae bacterium]|nr:hypothetical protein [Pseudobdellovibrionaceae bacterium]
MNVLKLTLAACVLISSCAKERRSNNPKEGDTLARKTESVEMRLAPYKSPCQALELRWCLTVLKDQGTVEFFICPIFSHLKVLHSGLIANPASIVLVGGSKPGSVI